MDYEIAEKDITSQLALVLRETVTMTNIAEGMDSGFARLKQHVAATAAETLGPPFVFSPGFGEDRFELIICRPVAEGAIAGEGVAVEAIPGRHVAFTTHRGPYPRLPDAYAALSAWMAKNGREPAGPARETYLNDPKVVPASELLTEVAIPLA